MNSKKRRESIPLKRCRYCKSTENLTIDHKVALVNGGKDEAGNFQCLCTYCNTRKSALNHKDVLGYFQWFLRVQEGRIKAGKKPYTLR